jgi:hypothetical protein
MVYFFSLPSLSCNCLVSQLLETKVYQILCGEPTGQNFQVSTDLLTPFPRMDAYNN